jgi:hypothetical protein
VIIKNRSYVPILSKTPTLAVIWTRTLVFALLTRSWIRSALSSGHQKDGFLGYSVIVMSLSILGRHTLCGLRYHGSCTCMWIVDANGHSTHLWKYLHAETKSDSQAHRVSSP